MIAKFIDAEQNILEVEKNQDSFSFFIYPAEEEQLGRSITL